MKFDKTHKRVVHEITDRYSNRLRTELNPVEIEDIIRRADAGSPADLCRLASELEEKNWDIRNSMATRCNALLGCEWYVTPPPGAQEPEGENIARHFQDSLQRAGELNEFDTFEELLEDLSHAIIAPYAVSEIIWDGPELIGFRNIPGHHFTFHDSLEPRLITQDHPEGILLPPHKFLIHHHTRTCGDICRGGLIRTLAWLHCFQSYPMKDWLAFAERYGMPFIVAKLDRSAYEKDRMTVQKAIRNFGPRGGGVFSKSMEIELLQAGAGNSSAVYEAIITHISEAITKVILGQLASSGKAAGLSGGDAQSKVRQDILEADAKKMEATIRAGIAAPWTAYHYGPDAPVPVVRFRVEPPEDLTEFARTLESLHHAGFDADPEEIGKRFGLHLIKNTMKQERLSK
ncbi:MAG: DUF935 family protein [Lentisphaeria bacterium]|nr:DUF935 family protein [Lentisphaeria bacterium]